MGEDVLRIMLLPGKDPVRFVRMRFRGNMSGITQVMGDAFQRLTNVEGCWHVLIPHEKMPWYFHAWDGEHLDCYGVKTGANCFAYWCCDVSGITLLLDLRSGSDGVELRQPLLCAEVMNMRSAEGESPYMAAGRFCSLMCDKLVIPTEPVYGFNNWAYGITDKETFVGEAKYLGEMTRDLPFRPYMVMDAGWQLDINEKDKGGPWDTGNERFGNMQEVAANLETLESLCKRIYYENTAFFE